MTRTDLEKLAQQTARVAGSAIAGERIIAQARKIDKTKVVAGTSTHKMQETILHSNALCVVDREFRIIRSS